MKEVFSNYLDKVIIIERKTGPSETGKVVAAHDDFLELENRKGQHSLVSYDQIGFIAEVPKKVSA